MNGTMKKKQQSKQQEDCRMIQTMQNQKAQKSERGRILIFKETFLEMIDVKEPNKFLHYLIENGFFTAPSSKKYNGNYAGGLFDHVLAVTDALIDLTNGMAIKWQNPRSPYLIGLFHDLCKMDEYLWIDDSNGGHYENNLTMLFDGHGEKSVLLLESWFTLTPEEALCIRYHMGPYEVSGHEKYGQAIKTYDTVLWTHTADMIAAKIKNT